MYDYGLYLVEFVALWFGLVALVMAIHEVLLLLGRAKGRFSLRTLLMATTVLAMSFGLFAVLRR